MEPAAEAGALSEAVVFLNYFKDMPDPRQRGNVIYPPAEILLLTLLAVLAGAETFVDIAWFAQKKLDLLHRFLPFRDGTPPRSPWRYFCDARRRGLPTLLMRNRQRP